MLNTIPISLPRAKRPFHVLVKPIGPICNLDCEYCFYLDKQLHYPEQNRFDMGEWELENHVRNYIASQPATCQEVVFGWQGGEPTLRGVSFFEKVVSLQEKYARPGMKITNTLQTNGVLIDEKWSRFLKHNNFLVGISLDGDEALHDTYRKTRSGKGSHALVMAGLEQLLKHQVDVNVLCVVQSSNGNHGERVYRYLSELGVQFLQFIPVVEPIVGSGVSQRSVGAEQFGRFMIDVFEAWKENDIGRVFVSHFDNALGMSLGMPSSSCVHAPVCGDNIVLEHNGDVYSCDHFVEPEFKLGNLNHSDYPNLIETPIQQEFALRKPTGSKLHCQTCPQRSLCNGACPAQRINSQGELDIHAKHHLCEGYYAFFAHIRPFLQAMGQCLHHRLPATAYRRFLSA